MNAEEKKSGVVQHSPADEDVAGIRGNIERTRANMSDTLGALQEKLNPTVLKEKLTEEFEAAKEAVKVELLEAKEAVKVELLEAKDALKDEVREQYEHARTVVHDATIGRVENMARSAGETMKEAKSSVLDTIRENPIPAAMAGLGLVWLLMNRRNAANRAEYRGTLGGPAERGMRQIAGRVQHVAHDVMDQASGAAQKVGNKADSLAHRASGQAGEYVDQAGQLAHRMQDQAGEIVHYAQDHAGQMARQARRTVQSTFEENPLAIAAVALALGTAVGLALPATELENEWMGETRDHLMERAGEVAHESLGKAQHAVEQLVTGETEHATGNGAADGKKASAHRADGRALS